MTQRICTAAEIKFYFNSFFAKGIKKTSYLQPNKNCNLSSWVSGCEPGWACRVGDGQKVDLRNSKDIPVRTIDCASCCEGFFCPNGITCMIRKYLVKPIINYVEIKNAISYVPLGYFLLYPLITSFCLVQVKFPLSFFVIILLGPILLLPYFSSSVISYNVIVLIS